MSESFETPSHIVTVEKLRMRLLDDYRLACISREASLLGRKEVLTGKAKFGIFGDGKELAQIAMAKQFQPGDWRSGYYRDQTFMMAVGQLTVQQYFAALYAHTDIAHEPSSGGRQMGGHFATRFINTDGSWKNLTEARNSSADISPTAGQMPRLLGLAQASKIYRQNTALHQHSHFSKKGNEVAFGTIGDASTSEGLFWETMNAAAVLGVPMCMSVWDDGWGISVPKKFQTVKESISEALSGFEKTTTTNGIKIFKAKGWNFPELLATYERAVTYCRENHIPVLVHVEEITQPQGHSTSGSHERYKSKELLSWYERYDCIEQLYQFIVRDGAASAKELDDIREEAKTLVKDQQKAAWAAYRADIDLDVRMACEKLLAASIDQSNASVAADLSHQLAKVSNPIRKDIFQTFSKVRRLLTDTPQVLDLDVWMAALRSKCEAMYSDGLYSAAADSVLEVAPSMIQYDDNPEMVDGRIILRENWDYHLTRRPELMIFGEDVGKIGGVNQTYEGLQDKHGELRVADTGIREATIIGQGIGLAMRGLRPVAEIQYLDYLYYALQIMRDDLSTVRYRSAGGQKAPLIISTRGHRLEGVWHAGSPMGAIIHSVRGMHVCVPRNMTQAAGMYNTLLECGEPALVVECLNGYRSKEPMPSNIGQFRIPLGEAEILREGNDLTVVSYGSTLHLCLQAAAMAADLGVEVEVIDVRTLLPFDLTGIIGASVQKTNKVIFVDEDVPGGATGYMLDEALNRQNIFRYLDAAPKTLASKPHLPAYGTDGDYFSKPSAEDILDAFLALAAE